MTTEDTNNTPQDNNETTTPPGFAPMTGSVRARYRRLNTSTGGWEDAPFILDGAQTCTIDAGSATCNVPFVEQVKTAHRISWYDSKGKVLGYSLNWFPFGKLESQGGASNTPRMWPAGSLNASAMPQGAGFLSASDTLTLLRGLSLVVHEAAAPMIAQVQAMGEQTLARERAFHEARMAAETKRHEETVQRDREFMAAMRDVHEAPRDAKIQALEAELAQFKADAEADRLDAEDDAQEKSDANAYDFAGKVVENAPDIIRTVAEEARKFKGEGEGNGIKTDLPEDS